MNFVDVHKIVFGHRNRYHFLAIHNLLENDRLGVLGEVVVFRHQLPNIAKHACIHACDMQGVVDVDSHVGAISVVGKTEPIVGCFRTDFQSLVIGIEILFSNGKVIVASDVCKCPLYFLGNIAQNAVFAIVQIHGHGIRL
ncbi:MAG: hypothetical protein IKH37_04440, partial [Prevotella sp.]|nr:hypothetical protein [Prevotella sp.]